MIEGALVFIKGLQLLLQRAELRTILWQMLALLVVLMLVLSTATFWLVDYFTALWIPHGDAWYWQLLAWFAGLFALILAVVCGVITFVIFGSAVSAPWLDSLSARTERIYGQQITEADGAGMRLIMNNLINAMRPLFGLIMWGGLALLFFWAPPVATAIWTYAGVRFLSYELIDPAASRRGWDFQARKQELLQRRWFYFGFAGIAMLLLMVPILNLLVIPAAAVGISRYMCVVNAR